LAKESEILARVVADGILVVVAIKKPTVAGTAIVLDTAARIGMVGIRMAAPLEVGCERVRRVQGRGI